MKRLLDPIRAIISGLFLVCMASAAAKAEDIGDPQSGAQVWKKCASCHMIGQGARNKLGPHLNEVFGRRAAGLDGFNYSKALRRAGADGVVWSRDKLEVFLENPKSLVSSTRMKFRGLRDKKERADLIAFLREYSSSPRDIPESAPTAAPTDPDVDPEILAIEGDTAYGEYLSSECVTCHQADGDDKGIPSITGWPQADFVTAMHAYKNQARPHPVMRMMAGRLSNEEIASLAAFFGGVK